MSLAALLGVAPLLKDAAPRSTSMAQASARRVHGQNKPGLIAGGATEVVGADDDRNAADPGAGGTEDAGGRTEGGSESMLTSDPSLYGRDP